LKAEAIVYSSNTGFTEQYAKMLGEKVNLAVFSLEDAAKNLDEGADIIYMSWVAAGRIKNWKTAAERYNIKAVCAVGIGSGEDSAAAIRAAMKLKKELPLFALPGGLDMKKLRGFNRFIMGRVRVSAIKALSQKTNRTENEEISLNLFKNGGSAVDEKFLAPVIAIFETEK